MINNSPRWSKSILLLIILSLSTFSNLFISYQSIIATPTPPATTTPAPSTTNPTTPSTGTPPATSPTTPSTGTPPAANSHSNQPSFTEEDILFHSNNDILFYNPNICIDDGSSVTAASVDLSNITIKPEATAKIESSKIPEKADALKADYIKALEANGINGSHWPVMAAIDYRERGFNKSDSIMNGQPITGRAYTNVDNVTIAATYEEDLKNGVAHLISNAKSVYGIDLTKEENWTPENIALAALAWNRGGIYKRRNLPPTDSGYIMQGTNEYKYQGKLDHPDACIGNPGGLRCNISDSNVGYLAVYSHLSNNAISSGGGASSSTDCIPGGAAGTPSSNGDVASLQNTVLAFIYYKKYVSNGRQKTQAYLDQLAKQGYSGGCGGDDCHAYVIAVIRASGWDPDYPAQSTTAQYSWFNSSANTKWTKVLSEREASAKYKDSAALSAALQPGDVFIKRGHAYLFHGKIEGVESMASSASLCDRAPMSESSWGLSPNFVNDFQVWRKTK